VPQGINVVGCKFCPPLVGDGCGCLFSEGLLYILCVRLIVAVCVRNFLLRRVEDEAVLVKDILVGTARVHSASGLLYEVGW